MHDDPVPHTSNTTPGWDLPTVDERTRAAALAAELGVPDVAGQVLVRRGLDTPATADGWLRDGHGDLHDPRTLPDLDGAVARLRAAIDAGERIVVHGDYDADGICGTALLTRGLRRLGATVEPFVPDRERDGYGVADRLVEHAGRSDVKVLVTVDTGSSAGAQLGRARALGMDVIVCDHHQFDERPDGVTHFVNPMRADSDYPHRDLCGSGIAYQLLRAVAATSGDDAEEELALAALATVGDQMPLRGENRTIVRRGLQQLGRSAIPGLRALRELARIGGTPDAQDVAFQLAPRINAPGRIERARTAVDLLLAPDLPAARALAQKVDGLNRERRRVGRECGQDAMDMARRRVEGDGAAGLVLSSPAWHRGIVGIAAARVVRAFERPALLLAIEGDEAVGSARSTGGVDLVDALGDCADLFTRFGGHAAAAGVTLPTDRIAELEDRFARAVAVRAAPAVPVGLRVDGVVDDAPLGDDLAAFLNDLGPFGQDNRIPRLVGLDWTHRRNPRVVGDGHLRLELDHAGAARGLIGFGRADEWMATAMASPRLDVAFAVRFRPDSNYDVWELVLDDLRPAAGDGRTEAGQ